MKQFIFCLFFLTNILSAQNKSCLIVDIHSQIDPRSSRYLTLALEEAQTSGYSAILIDMNTYGGTVADADKMVSAILETDVPVYVYIDKNAGSAGSFIALACDSIYFTEGAVMGASTVVTQDMSVLPEKIQSYQRTKMRSVAETKGRNPKIAEELVGINLQTDTAFVRVLTYSEALELGFSEGTYGSQKELIDFLGFADTKVFSLSTSDQLSQFFLNPSVKAILIIMIFGGLYLEIKTPGFGFPIVVSLVGVIGYFVPDYLYGFLENWELLIFVLGVFLLVLEIFVIPGFGLAGVLGIMAIFLSLFLSMIGNVFFFFFFVNGEAISTAFQTVGIGFLLAIVLLFLSASLLYKSKRFRKMTVQATIDTKINESLKNHEGKQGITSTDLRPSGKVIIDDVVMDAMSGGEFIECGREVIVVGRSNAQIVVRENK